MSISAVTQTERGSGVAELPGKHSPSRRPRSVCVSAVTHTETGGGTPRISQGRRHSGCELPLLLAPVAVCVTKVSDPSACSLAGLRPSHQRGTPPLLPERSAVVAAFDRGGSDQFEPGTIAQRGSGASSFERTWSLLSGTSVSGCRPGSTINNKARAAHLCRERRAGQEG